MPPDIKAAGKPKLYQFSQAGELFGLATQRLLTARDFQFYMRGIWLQDEIGRIMYFSMIIETFGLLGNITLALICYRQLVSKLGTSHRPGTKRLPRSKKSMKNAVE